MVFSVKTGQFTKNSGGANSTQIVSGVGFQSKLLVLYTAGTVLNSGYAENYSYSVGFAINSGGHCVSAASNDNAGTAVTGRAQNSGQILTVINGTATILWNAAVQTLNADGFTLIYPTNNGSGDLVNYLAIGGGDVSNVAQNFASVPSATGVQLISGAGFQGNLCVILAAATSGNVNINSGLVASIGFGLASGICQSIGVISEHTPTQMDTAVVNPSNASGIVNLFRPTDNAATHAAALFDGFHVDGIELNWTTVAGTSGGQIFYAILKGGKYGIGSFNRQSGVTTQTVSYNPQGGGNLTGQGVLLMSVGRSGSATGVVAGIGNKIHMGTATSGNEVSVAQGDQDAANTSIVVRRSRSDLGFISIANENATAGSTVTASEGDVTASGTNQFGISWTTSNASGEYIQFLAMGASGVVVLAPRAPIHTDMRIPPQQIQTSYFKKGRTKIMMPLLVKQQKDVWCVQGGRI